MLEEFAARYLDQADAVTRLVLEAACVVRRMTPSLLSAMLPELAPQDALERLQALPFVRSAPDGLAIHATLKEAEGRYSDTTAHTASGAPPSPPAGGVAEATRGGP